MSMKWQFPKFDHRWRAMCSKEPQTNNNNLNLGINTHNIHTRADLKQSQPGQQTSKKMGQSFPINQHSQNPPHLEPMSSQSEVVCSKVTQSFIKPILIITTDQNHSWSDSTLIKIQRGECISLQSKMPPQSTHRWRWNTSATLNFSTQSQVEMDQI